MSLLSRVAERMYWSTRYFERAENTARLVRVYGDLLLDLPRQTGLGWEQLIQITGSEEVFHKVYPQPAKGTAENFLIADPANASAILSCLAQARENIRTTRDIVPSEAWRCTNELLLYAREHLGAEGSQRRRREVMSRIVERCQQLTGLLHGTMSQGTAYQFVRLGRNLERADMTSRIIDVAAATLLIGREELLRFDNRLWMTVLQSLSAYQMYRQHVRRRVRARDVMAYLLQDELFPRALNHCLRELSTAFGELPRNTEAIERVDQLRALLSEAPVDEPDTKQLHQWIDDVQLDLARLDAHVQRNWFAPVAIG